MLARESGLRASPTAICCQPPIEKPMLYRVWRHLALAYAMRYRINPATILLSTETAATSNPSDPN